MAFDFKKLDVQIRRLMLEEVLMDETRGEFFRGKYTNDTGKAAFPQLLKQAVQSGNEVSLAQSLHSALFLKSYTKKTPSGGTTTAAVPHNANIMLAEGEFNRFYIRAICRLATEQGLTEVRIYRAKQVNNPRTESQKRIGQLVDAQSLLSDLRSSIGVDTALGCPSGPNSGLSVTFPYPETENATTGR